MNFVSSVGHEMIGRYEQLRASVFGGTDQVPMFAEFLRNGMAFWIRGITAHLDVPKENYRSSSSRRQIADFCETGTQLASVLAGSILKAAGPSCQRGGAK